MNTRNLLLGMLILMSAAVVLADDLTVARPDSSRFLAVRRHTAGFGLVPDDSTLAVHVAEPLFAFVFRMVEHDSLGTWTAADLETFAATWVEPSEFPLGSHLVRLTREALVGDEVLTRRGARCRRRWRIVLAPAPFEMPMPYSILGYHPGTLSFQSPIVVNEWRVGSRSIYVSIDDDTRKYAASSLTVFQITEGWMLLDVDGWIDRILGKAADDAAMLGFTVGWLDGKLMGVGNSVGRDGRKLLGELDFQTGKIASHGRPLAKGLSALGRRWTWPRDRDPREVWQRYER